MLNLAFAYESIEINELNGVRQETRTYDFRLFPIMFIVLLGKMLLVYSNALYLLPKILKTRNWKIMVPMVGLLMVGVFLLEFMLAYVWSFIDPRITVGDYLRFWKLNALFFICYYGVSVAYALSRNWWENEKNRHQIEQEKLSTELDYLKSQLNPHFFFNTLNNLYALSERHNNTELSNGIASLSNMMRYMLYDAKADLVPLQKEIVQLKTIIEVEQLRYDDKDDFTIALNIEGELEGKMIAPLILIPFVENAFKHGIKINAPSFIKINLSVNDNEISFKVINSNHHKSENTHQHSGIGLKNVKRRLQLLYPDKHHLAIEDNSDNFKIHLHLKLAN